MSRLRRLVLLSVPALLATLVPGPTPAQAVRADCTPRAPRAYRATMAPDQGTRPYVTSAHRGGVDLAPQQTRQAYLGAIAYGVDLIEVDVRRTADGVLVAVHDADPAGVGVERRPISQLTLAAFKQLNAALPPWTGTRHDPARYLTVDEVIALAGRYRVGLDIEFKDVGIDRSQIRATAAKVQRAGILDRTIWQHEPFDDVVTQVRSVDPGALFNLNIGSEPPLYLYQQAVATEYSFGSKLEEFTVDRIAAIHDGCGLALPHSYDGLNDADASPRETARERQQMVDGLAKGVDGFQTNRPDAAAAALGQPVTARLVQRPIGACLVDGVHGLPLSGRRLLVQGVARTSGKGGCVPARAGALVRWPGDGAALASPALRVRRR